MTKRPPTGFFFSALLAALAVTALTGCQDVFDDFFGDDQSDRAVARLAPTSAPGAEAYGTVYVYNAEGGGVRVSGTLYGLDPGPHGFHIHRDAECGAADTDGDGEAEPGGAAGPHWDPLQTNNHAGLETPFEARHAGDLGNIVANDEGVAVFSIRAPALSVGGTYDVRHHALIVHEDEDDLETDPGGNSGQRLGCGVLVQSE